MTADLARRDFLRRAAGAAALVAVRPAAGLATASERAARRPEQAQRLVIVGAGMAGLAAAFELTAQGHDVTVLEARTRPGGRVLTLREPFADGLYAEAGAMQVFDTHRRVWRFLKELGLDTDPIQASPLASLTFVHGRRVESVPGRPTDWPFELTAKERDRSAGSLTAQYVAPLLDAIGRAEEEGKLLATYGPLDRVTFSDYLRQQGASPAAVDILAVGLVSGLGDGADQVSALDLLREAAHRQMRKQSFTIRGGTDLLPRALAKRLADRIKYGTAVVRLEQDASGARAVARVGADTRVFAADRIICTIPFSVLRRVDVAPALSAPKRDAIARLRYTSVARVFLQTRTRFWVEDHLSGNASTDLPVMGVYERSVNQPGTRGMLESYRAGAAARRATSLSESERLTTTLAGVAQVFPRIREQFEGGASKCWDADEWSRGAYAWFAPGEMSSLLPHVGTPEGRIHFAGEHASSSPGWIEGALESAERVVGEIGAAAG